jgi:glycosyltransferase involved in cell wall biosynthesis
MSIPRLRIALDNSLARRNRAGTGVYVSQLVQQLSARPELSLEVFEGWDWGNGSRSMASRALGTVGRLAWLNGYFPYFLRKQKFDLVHSPAFLLPVNCPCPSVVTVHDLIFLIVPEQFGRGWRSYVTPMMPRVLKSASAVICVSESAKQDVLRFYGLPPSKVHVVHNGVDHSRFHPRNQLDQKWAHSIGLTGEYVLHVGAFAQRKNIPLLLEAIAQLKAHGKFENRQVVLAGGESPGLPGAREIAIAIKNFDLCNAVVLAGHVPDEKLPGLYAGAGLLAMPSSYEGFGLPVLEAMAAGTPVVASNISSLPEVAGDAAILVPPQDVTALANAIDDVLSSKAAADELRQKGFSRAREFSWERAAANTIAVYRSVAGT